MSIEIVNIFTSSENIKYLTNELSNQINDPTIRNSILENITETIFDFQNYAIIENSGRHLRQSTSIKNEVDRLNKAFIKDRLAFASNFNTYASGREEYADQMFIDDSLRPGPYNHYNDCINESSYFDDDKYESSCDRLNKKRIFRYQDKNNTNRSNIPIWQVLNRGNPEQFNDELRNSELSQVRRASEAVTFDHIKSLPTAMDRPNWIDN